MTNTKKGLRSLLGLGAAAVALLIYIVQVELPRDAAHEEGIKVFPSIAIEDIAALNLKNHYGNVSLQHSGNTAQGRPPLELTTLPGAMLSTENLQEIVNALAALTTGDLVQDPDTDLASYGLQPAVTELAITLKNAAEEKKILIGKENAFASKRYSLLNNDGKIYLIDGALFAATDLKEEGFRERKPIKFESYNLASIDIEGEGTLTQDDKNAWNITAPAVWRVDDAAVSKFLRALKEAEVESFLPVIDDRQKFNKKIVLHYKDGKTDSFSFKVTKDSVVGALSYEATPFKFKKEFASTLEDVFTTIRVKRLLSEVTPDTTQKISLVQKGGESFAVVSEIKDGAAERSWRFENAPKAVDEAFIKEWLNNIKNNEVAGYLQSSADVGLGAPIKTLTITTMGGKTIVMNVGNHTPKDETSGYYVSVSGYEGEVFIISDLDAKKLFPSRESLEKSK